MAKSIATQSVIDAVLLQFEVTFAGRASLKEFATCGFPYTTACMATLDC